MKETRLAVFCDEHAVEVGQVLSGHVTWSDAPANTRNIVVSLQIVVHGDGNGFRDIVKNVTLSVPTPTGEADFRFPVPQDLSPTYVGRLFSVSWQVQARLDVGRAIDPKVYMPVVVRPAGWDQARSGSADQRRATNTLNTLPIIDPGEELP